ncbi:solute carrier family 23 member 1 [Octopus bimaculoides]|uniref:SLC26A/SulP transporter domain-containing protein n=1 Tax=Octopus bimaculoides TaxID=37653 RepID=A0A0L8GNW1_OCTBM|nr:solute carrier family 23 member 1 [Octopus bimaculoides]XP_014779338.1 solute carrier family 23 member 1 [Octopus bimaculoides]XP_052825740.1 solute carrier family 23 member 1 [Octopus bimaculoides]|eukprot:XP_014779337.1 PREDICTED: solute carrier family 23 member 1-like [Octopus bimaculoides]
MENGTSPRRKSSNKLDSEEVNFDEDPNLKYNLVYGVLENPPIYVSLSLAVQNILTLLAGAMGFAAVLADLVCVDVTDPLRAQLFSTTVILAGVATVAQTSLGTRLPVFQGPSISYLPPMLSISRLDNWKCPPKYQIDYINGSTVEPNTTLISKHFTTEYQHKKLMVFSGSLVCASFFEVVVAFFGIPGIFGRLVSPVTVSVTLITIGLSLLEIALKYSALAPAVAIPTAACASVFILYLNGVTLKFPPWSKKPKEIAIFRNYPLLLAVGIGWILCYIFTVSNYYPSDPNSRSFNARTDTKLDLIQRTPWFSFPYPGQYGPPKFEIAIFLGFLLSTINSIIESMGDYYAASRLCAVPPPPRHAINRGLFSEGLAGVLAGFMGASHATTSYSTHIALIGITRVASRIVLNIAGVMVIIMAILGKVAASLATIPDPVVGAINFTGLTMMLSVGITNLQKTALNARNTLIIGSSLGLSWVSSSWLYTYPDDINTGNFELDQILKIILGTQTFVGTLTAILLDNTIPGTLTERGMHHLLPETENTEKPTYHTGEIVYEFPSIQNFLNKHQSIFGKLAILPPKKVIEVDEETEKLKDEIDQTDLV